MTANELLERLGTNWADLVDWLGGKSKDEIKAEFDCCWPHEKGNRKLAKKAHAAIQHYGSDEPHPNAEL